MKKKVGLMVWILLIVATSSAQSKDEIDMEEFEKKELIGRDLEKQKQILIGMNEIQMAEIEEQKKIVFLSILTII